MSYHGNDGIAERHYGTPGDERTVCRALGNNRHVIFGIGLLEDRTVGARIRFPDGSDRQNAREN